MVPPPSDAENYKLIFAMISQISLPQLDWALIGNELGIKGGSAQTRWKTLQKRQKGKMTQGPAPKQKAATLAGVKKAPGKAAKRKAADMNSDEAETEHEDEGEISGGDMKGKENGLARKKAKRDHEIGEDGFVGHEVYTQDGGEDMEDGGVGFEVNNEEQQDISGEDDYAVLEYGQYYDGYPDVEA